MKILPIASTRLLLKNRISKNSYIKEVVFTDAEGTLTYSSIDETKNYKINYSDRIWYKQLKSGDRGLIVSPIVKSKIHGGYTVPFVRGVYNDNVLVGTVILTLDLEYFDKFYKNINVGNYESIFIVGMDGYYRFRRISGEITRVENKKSDISYPFFKNYDFIDGVYYLDVMKDNISRYIGFKKLNDYPLFVSVGYSYHEWMFGYYVETFIIVGLLLLFSGALVYFLNKEKKMINNIEIQNIKLIELKEIAEQTDQLKSHFIARMSHKLKNPLNIILGYSDLVTMNMKDAKQLEQIGYIKQASYNLLDMVTNLLEVSRHDTLVINCEHYYIAETIVEICDLIKHKIKDKMLSFFEASKGKKGFRHNKVDFYFITLTFINKVNDKLAISVLNKFLTVLKNKYGNFGYIWVAEKQQNGNIHYHMIADKRFNLYYLNSLWTVQQINSGIRNYEQEYECLDKEKVTINDLHSAKSWQTIQKYLNPVDIKPVKTIEGISAYLTSYVTKNDSKFYCSSWHCNRQVSRIFTSSAINRDVFDITCDSNKNRIKTIKGKEYINTTYFGQYCIINTIYNKSYYRRYLDEMRLINRYILLKEREIKIDHDFVYKYNLVDNQQYRERFKVNLLEFQN